MNEPERVDAAYCPECAALVGVGVPRCWLCGWRRDGAQASTPPVIIPSLVPRRPTDRPFSYSLESLLLLVTLVAVGLGAIVNFPGIGIVVAILMAPAFVRTAMVIRRRDEIGRPVTRWQRVGLFFGSFATAIVILVLVVVASVGTFFTVCLGLFSADGTQDLALPLAMLSAGMATAAIIGFAVWWIRRRWQHDTER
jgi:hypothetical protein